jgi:hypothetical protein
MPWNITGNAGTTSANFLGTTDAQPLVVKVSNTEAMRVDTTGNVGIGTSAPGSKLEIHAQDGLGIVGYEPFLTLTDSNGGGKRARIQTGNGDIAVYNEGGFSSGTPAVVIKGDTNTVQIAAQDGLQIVGYQPFLTLTDSNGGYQRSRIQSYNGNMVFYTDSGIGPGTPALVLENGSGHVQVNTNLHVAKDVVLMGADCAEHFDIADNVQCEPGTVMVINDEGMLEPSSVPYDRRVAGVVSGAGDFRPGIILDKQTDSNARLPVALVGKVYCKADARGGPIHLGDPLTTSDRAGFAMKASESSRAFGAVIGKALRPLTEGQGLIPILVALQ